jgi:hypothetical protein
LLRTEPRFPLPKAARRLQAALVTANADVLPMAVQRIWRPQASQCL